MGEVLKKFGRYFLLDQIAQGGMAEIYRARLASLDGAGRLLVIKRIQAGFGANAEFLQMFKSEIKVTMGFNHPNIVQLYDFGEENDQPYIAMEFVDGKNLRQFLSRFSELKQTFPVELAAYIIEQGASALHYAHCFKDKITGQPLNIVHRDISPQNILISFEGNIKVIDFGIAKAATNSEATRAGVIKGKPSYLSPEQISGEPLDGRCDIFALGIVLWELLTGKKLFAGENDLAVLKLIESCNSHVKPPSTLNPKVPKELDYIVLKMLAKQREKRYQNGEELQRALHKFLYSFNPDFNPGDLAYYAKDLFKNDIVEDRKRIQRLNEKVEQLLAADIPDAQDEVPTPGRGIAEKDTTTVVDSRKGQMKIIEPPSEASARVEIDPLSNPNPIAPAIPIRQSGPAIQPAAPRATGTAAGPSIPAGARAPSMGASVSQPGAPANPALSRNQSSATRMSAPAKAPPPAKPRVKSKAKVGEKKPFNRNGLVAAVAAVALVVLGPEVGIEIPIVSDAVNEWLGGGQAKLVLEGDAKGVQVYVNGQNVASTLPTTISGMPVGTALQVSVTGQQGVFAKEITLRKGEKKKIPVVLTPLDSGYNTATTSPAPASDGSVKTIQLRLNISPGGVGATISVNGKLLDPLNPVTTVALDAPLELVAERPGFRTFRREFVLDSRQTGGLNEWLMDVPLEPVRFGLVTIRTTPSADAIILIDGRPWIKKTPMEGERIPVGTYNIRLVNEVLGMEKTVTIQVQEGKSITLDERLEIKN